MVGYIGEAMLERTHVSLSCSDRELPEVLRVVYSRPARSCIIENVQITPNTRPAWNVSFVRGPIFAGALSPIECMKRLGLDVYEDVVAA